MLVDATQAVGRIAVGDGDDIIDYVALSGHKIYGPKGIGALYVRRRGGRKRPLTALLYGGGQERGLRPGTMPVPLAVGLGKAAELAAQEHLERRQSAAIRQ